MEASGLANLITAHKLSVCRAAVLAALLLCLVSAGCLSPRPFDEEAWRRTVAQTDAQDLRAPHQRPDGTFFNPWLPHEHSFGRLLRWWLSANALPEAADPPVPVVANDGAYLRDAAAPPSLTWVGHATYVVQWGGQVVITDPMFSRRALLPARLAPPAFGPEAIPAGAVVLISHNHYDHLDADSVAALGDRCVFLCPLGLGEPLRDMGARQVREMDWWQQAVINGATFTCLPTQHWSRRLGQGYNESLWCAWMMERQEGTVFYGADSGWYKGFAVIGQQWPEIDVALLPVGAYEPRWFMHYSHMNIAEALRAFADLGARLMVPTQWGVFDLGDEPASHPAQELRQELARRPELADRVRIMPVGGRLMLDGDGHAD